MDKNIEQIEAELMALIQSSNPSGEKIIVIRPMWGDQSDSWNVSLRLLGSSGAHPLRFEWNPIGCSFSSVFKSTDVKSVIANIIRLKGPHDYAQSYQTH